LGRQVGGREHCRAARHCTASENHTALPEVGKGKWSRFSYASGDTVRAREAPGFQESAGRLSQEVSLCLF